MYGELIGWILIVVLLVCFLLGVIWVLTSNSNITDSWSGPNEEKD